MSVGNTANSTKSKKENNDEDIDDVDIYLCVLFDGTNNNLANIERYNELKSKNTFFSRKRAGVLESTHGSATDSITNVARYSQICRVDESNKKKMYSFVYVDGIGTSTGLLDSKIGKGLGYGLTGVNAKVSKGCRLVCNELNRLSQKFSKKSRVKLHLFVSGFSRGATAARRFVSCIEKEQGTAISLYNECLKKHLSHVGEKVVAIDDIEVLMLGIFDTVSSYGLDTDNVKTLALDKIYDAKKIMHICAGDEYREHFALTKVKESGTSKNYIIPGAHCDIGGGYPDKSDDEWVVLDKKKQGKGKPDILCYNGFKTRDDLVKEGWFTEDQISKGQRKLTNAYAFIAYCYMRDEFAKVEKKIFDSSKEKSKGYGEKVINKHGLLKKFFNDIMGNKVFYSFEGERMSSYKPQGEKELNNIKYIRNHYLHLSAKAGIGMGPDKNNIRTVVQG